MLIKKELRTYYINILKSLTTKIKKEKTNVILKKLKSLIYEITEKNGITENNQNKATNTTKNICAFLPKNDQTEIDLTPLMLELYNNGYNIFIPYMNSDIKDKILRFINWHPMLPIQYNAFGIPEYKCIEKNTTEKEKFLNIENNSFIMIVPLLAFDMNFYRLGRGGGYYDKTLEYIKNTNKKTKKIVTTLSAAFDEQKSITLLPNEKHDQQIDIIITDRENLNLNIQI